MRKRYIRFEDSGTAAEALASVLQRYAYIAFPPGGSECATASRETLLGYAREALSEKGLTLGSRQFPMIKAALKWYYTEIEPNPGQLQMILNKFIKQ